MKNKIKSFTLAELLVVMIITAIVVGIAFSVLRLVQKQIVAIQKNYNKSTSLSLFEQRLWQDFNIYTDLSFDSAKGNLFLKSPLDSVTYTFEDRCVLRNNDTIPLKLEIEKIYFEGKEVQSGAIDAISFSGEAELRNYRIFVSKKNDLNHSMNQEDGL
jgi:type II secretory pathway pseudopilin PulG